MAQENKGSSVGSKLVGNAATLIAVVLVWATLDETIDLFGSDVPAWVIAIAMYLLGAAMVWGLSPRPKS